MANVSHSTLTGADLHEPKGVSGAASGTVYIANGSGSGSWGSIATSLNFTGMIADFVTPTAPTGWLECTGAAVSRTTYSDLFTVQTIQQSGTRTSGSAVITGLSSTTNIKSGYKVGGTGITNGSTVVSVDSGSQITISANATSSGTSTVIVSPWGLGDGSTTFNLPDATTSGKFRRSRTSSVVIGTSQTSQNVSHTHTGTTDAGSAHTHGITDPQHTHSASTTGQLGTSFFSGGGGGGVTTLTTGSVTVNAASTGITVNSESAHTHTFTSASSGSSEARPESLVFITCVKY